MAGKRGRKRLSEWDYLQVTTIADATNFIPDTEIQLLDSGSSQETKVIKKDLFDKLTEEAKEVIEIVTNRPANFVRFAVKTDPAYARYHLPKRLGDRRLRFNRTKHFPRETNGNRKVRENRLRNLDIISLFFKRRWKKNHRFVEEVIEEIRIFTYSSII